MTCNPVVLVHGIHNTGAMFYRMKRYLEDRGFQVHSLNLVPNNGKAALPELAQQLNLFIQTSFATDGPIDIVGFSMGGLVARYYIQRLGGIHRTGKFVTIGTPHRGTWMAFLRSHPGVRNMRPGSLFLEDLNRDIEMLNRLSFTSIWTPFDLMIVPANSSFVPVGRSIRVGTPVHPLLVFDSQVLKLVFSLLREGSGKESSLPGSAGAFFA
jgi:triacylglycerol lipase